jgi:hypothetical protein
MTESQYEFWKKLWIKYNGDEDIPSMQIVNLTMEILELNFEDLVGEGAWKEWNTHK